MRDTTPSYYLIPMADRDAIEAMDVIDGLGLNFNLGCVVKYIVRAGRKQGASTVDDLTKALHCLTREVSRAELAEDWREATQEAPEAPEATQATPAQRNALESRTERQGER